jgi:cytochrome c553
MKGIRRALFTVPTRPSFSPAFSLVLLMVIGCGTPDPVVPPPPVVDNAQAIERGAQLVNGLASCGFCHSLDGRTASALSGGRRLQDAYGEVHGPNITGARSGIAAWSDTDLRRLLRGNIRPDDSEISAQLHRGFEWLADGDITAITAYLRTLTPVEHEVAPRRLSFIERNTTGLFESRLEVKGYVPAIGQQFKREYGGYLVDHVARCGSCHNKPGDMLSSESYMAGGNEVSFDGEQRRAPNITMSTSVGIGAWSESALVDYLRSGRTPAGREVDSLFCPVQFYATASAEQIEAVVAYLRTVPAVE